MKKFILFFSFSVSALLLNSKAIQLPVTEVLKSITSIQEIKVLSFKGDSIMVYENTKTKATLEMDCRDKKYSEELWTVMSERDSSYGSWEGTYPKVGETVIMVEHNYAGDRLLFARVEDEHYRFWDPNSIPFANTVYYISENSICKPTRHCLKYAQEEQNIGCSDGFRMTKGEFEKLKKGY